MCFAAAGASTPTWRTRTATSCSRPVTRKALSPPVSSSATNPNGLRNPDGSFFTSAIRSRIIASLNEGGRRDWSAKWSPRGCSNRTRGRSSFGWSHQLAGVDRVQRRRHPRRRPGPQRARAAELAPGRRAAPLRRSCAGSERPANFRVVISPLESVYDALLLSLRRRSATGHRLRAELHAVEGQERAGPGRGRDRSRAEHDPGCDRPVRDRSAMARPRATRGISSRSARSFRSRRTSGRAALLLSVGAAGLHHRGPRSKQRFHSINDIPGPRVRVRRLGRAPRDIGPCRTINCGRGAGSSQFNFRVSRRFTAGASRVTVIAEVFNLFNASNPSASMPVGSSSIRCPVNSSSIRTSCSRRRLPAIFSSRCSGRCSSRSGGRSDAHSFACGGTSSVAVDTSVADVLKINCTPAT